MKRIVLLFSLVMVLALAACNGQLPNVSPTAEAVMATEVPAVATAVEAVPTEAVPAPSGSVLDTRPHTADPLLIDKLWQWERRDPNGNAVDEIVVPNPENYTLFFNADGTFNAQLDCNTASGRYATSTTGGIYMELGPMTRMACPPESLSDAMMQTFGPAQSYRFEEDGAVLVLSWAAGGPVDYYRLADSVVAGPSLTGTVWQWTGTTTPVEQIAVADPSRYTIQFNEDGSANIKADCNVVLGQYTTDDAGAITITLGPTTLVACPEDSQDQVFTTGLAAAAVYFFDGENLLIDQFASSGTMHFAPQPEPELVGTTWQWLGTVTPVEEFVPTDSSRYLVTFNEDGTATVVADCNNVIMGYTVDGNSLTMLPGPSTLVACPEDSLGTQFVQQLSNAAIYFFQDGELYIDQAMDSGTLRFSALPEVALPDPGTGQASGTVSAPDGIFLRSGPGTNYPAVGTAPMGDTGTIVGVSEDGGWYVVSAPDFPGGQVWVSASFVTATGTENLPVVPAPPLPTGLTGTTWEWVSLTTPEAQTQISDPTRYTILFNEDGTANIKADCNVVLAQYTVTGSSISIIPGPSTLAACPDDSQDQLFIQSLTNASIYFFEGSDLLMDQFADAGTLRFSPAGSSAGTPIESAPGSVSGGAAGVPFRVVSFGPAGAENALMPGTTITATFDDVAGIVSGNAGCNTYTGTLTPTTMAFTVGPIASTLMFCAEPAGVMDQETAYLTALAGTNGYRWEQSRTAAGSLVTTGTLSYALGDGTTGIINLVSP